MTILTKKVTIEITTKELTKLKIYLVRKRILAKAGVGTTGLLELLLARILVASEREGAEDSVKEKRQP